MEQSFLANRESELIKLLNNIIINDDYVDSIDRNLPSCVKYIQKMDSRETGEGLAFDFPTTGFLSNMYLELTLTTSQDKSSEEDLLATRIFDRITLKQHNKIIQSLTPEYIISRIDQEPKEKRDALHFVSSPQEDWNNNTVTVRCPLFFSCLEHSKKNFLLDYVRRLELVCEQPDDDSFTLSAKLVCVLMNYEKEFYNAHIKNAMNGSVGTLSYDIHCDSVALTTGSTSTKLYLTATQLVQSVHVLIKNASGSIFKINSFDLVVNSQKVVDNASIETLIFDNKFTEYHAGNRPLVHFFSRDKTRLEHTGALNFNGLSEDKYITVNYDTIPAGYTLHVVCEYLTVMQLDVYGHLHRQMIS